MLEKTGAEIQCSLYSKGGEECTCLVYDINYSSLPCS